MAQEQALYQLLIAMQRIRKVEEGIAARYSQGKMRCPTHLSIGQEVVGAALGVVLERTDFTVSSHRAHAHYLGKGGDLKKMLAEIYGKATGCSKGIGGSMHLADPEVGFMGSTAIVANSIPVGVGLALSVQLKGDNQVSCCCFGDGAIEEGAFYEAANFAALKKLSVIFLCENNLYSVYSPLSVRQPENRKIYELARSIGLYGELVDGNDGEAVIAALSSAADRARQGEGPQFLELTTYRWREHCGPNYDNDIGYRTEAEYEIWKAKDPIRLLEKKLSTDGSPSYYQAELKALDDEIEAAFLFAESSPFPATGIHQRYLYSGEAG